MRFDGKVIVVTGGALGIGRAACEIFAERGASVSILDWDEKAGSEICDEIRKSGGAAMFTKVNVADQQAVKEAVERTGESWTPIILVRG